MISLLSKISNWKFMVPAFLLAVFLLFQFHIGQNEMDKIAHDKLTMIDLMEKYSVDDIQELFIKLKPEGRAIHQKLTNKTDMIFPLAYGLLFILVIAFFIKNIFGRKSKLLYLSLIPLLLMVVDYMENFNTLTMLRQFPSLTEELVNKGSKLTILKHVLTNISYILMIVGLIIYLFYKLKNRNVLLNKK